MDEKAIGAGQLQREWKTNASRNELGSYELVGGQIGDPIGTARYSADELKKMGMVGIYKTAQDFKFVRTR